MTDTVKVKVKALRKGHRLVEMFSKREKATVAKSILVSPGEVFELDVVKLGDGSPRIPRWCELVAELDSAPPKIEVEVPEVKETPKPKKPKLKKPKPMAQVESED